MGVSINTTWNDLGKTSASGTLTVKVCIESMGSTLYDSKDGKMIAGVNGSKKVTLTDSHTSTNGGTKGVHTKCKYCSKTLTTTHTYTTKSGVEYKAATCTASQKCYYSCACGYNPKDKTKVYTGTKALGHSWDSGTVQGGYVCTGGNTLLYTCTRTGCSATKKETTGATGSHNLTLSSKIQEPTCEDVGQYEYTCLNQNCTYTEIREIDATGHNYEDEIIQELTCENDEITRHTCSVCGDEKDEVTKEHTGHEYTEEIIQNATCTEPEITKYTCSKCEYSHERETGKPLGHKLKYIQDGQYVYHKCVGDNCDYIDKYIGIEDLVLPYNGFVQELPLYNDGFTASMYTLTKSGTPQEIGEYLYTLEVTTPDGDFTITATLSIVMADIEYTSGILTDGLFYEDDELSNTYDMMSPTVAESMGKVYYGYSINTDSEPVTWSETIPVMKAEDSATYYVYCKIKSLDEIHYKDKVPWRIGYINWNK